MPSSPGPTDYSRTPQRFFYRGISLSPQDAQPEGKVAYAINIRSRQDGQIEPRYGLTKLTDSAFASPIHSMFRLNDTTPYATPSSDEWRFLGNGTLLGAQNVDSGVTSSIDTGYSGNPLTGVVASPYQSPRPWLYLADEDRMRKVNSDLDVQPIGIPQPLTPPSAELAAVQVTYLNSIGPAAWVGYGGTTTPVPTVSGRISTTVTQLLYDSGAIGMACVALADMGNVTEGVAIDIGSGSSETVIVDTVHPALSPTTIGAIIYDIGTNGLCTIQPDAGFSVGQIEAPLPDEIRKRYDLSGDPQPPRVTINRTVDFPVNSLVLLGGVEVVRILSVAIGKDGVQSFRCATTGTFVATDTISGIAAFRAYFNTTKAVGDGAQARQLQVTLTPTTTDPDTGGVQSPMTGGERNWGLVGNRATQPDDLVTFGVQISQFGVVKSVRLMLNVSNDDGAGGSDFLHNYYFYEWRESDLKLAVQSASPSSAGLVVESQKTAVFRGQVTSAYGDQFGGSGWHAPLINTDPTNGTDVDASTGKYLPRTQAELDRRARQAQIDGSVSTGSTTTRQLALGDNQWMTLHCRIGDLTRVGTDPTLTLNVILGAAITVTVEGTTDPILINVSDAYLRGGYGPDVGTTLPPYVYRYRYRDTITGARSNPSPPMRAGVMPRRGRVALTGAQSGYSANTVVDWFRFGGAMARWTYTGTSPDASIPTYNDDNADGQIDGGEPLRLDLYQPWPTSDQPRSGICNVAGTAVEWVSGSQFNLDWAPNSAIIINGFATTLFSAPDSATKLSVVDNVGQGTNIAFELPSPTLLSQPLPAIWGGPINGSWFHFGCGDTGDAGSLRWTNGNDPDTTSDANYLVVSTASEPLVNGFFAEDGTPFVFSSDALYQIVPNFGGISTFVAAKTACDKGLWSRVAFAKTPYGVFFLAKDGIYLTNNGSAPIPISSPDLQSLFPQDGSVPEAVRGILPVDMSEEVTLTWVDQLLYVDYLDTDGHGRTLVYEPLTKAWTPDIYALSGAKSRIAEPGPGVHTNVFGGIDGNIYQVDADQITDVHTAIDWAVWTPWANGNDPRAYKQWGDTILDMNPAGTLDGITVTPVVDNGNVLLTPSILGVGDTERNTYIAEVTRGIGVISRNLGLQITGTCQVCSDQRPILYLWEPSFLFKQVAIARRATDWEDLGYKGAKFVQGVVIRANTFGQDKTVRVEYDGVNLGPLLTINHDGELAKAYPLASAGWPPFVAELVRLHGADDLEWTLLDWRWVWEPAPEAATQWETQFTTFDYPGFLHVLDGVIAYQATAAVTWEIEYQDGSTTTYTLASTGNVYERVRQITATGKGKAVRFKWTSAEPFRLYKNDISVRVQGWGIPGGYAVASPFGGPSRADGAGL